jgi:hypothetical protein
MKQFYSFLNAIYYHEFCPLCKSKLEIDDRGLSNNDIDRCNDSCLAFNLSNGLNSRDILFINPVTEKVEITIERYRFDEVVYGNFDGQIPSRYSSPTLNDYSGKFLQGLTVDCKSCCQFSYTIQIHVDLDERRLIGTFLNSETISIEDEDMVHEIKNVYSIEQTHYSYFSKDGVDKKSTIPLIPLDLKNPKETISRIRKLLIFS